MLTKAPKLSTTITHLNSGIEALAHKKTAYIDPIIPSNMAITVQVFFVLETGVDFGSGQPNLDRPNVTDYAIGTELGDFGSNQVILFGCVTKFPTLESNSRKLDLKRAIELIVDTGQWQQLRRISQVLNSRAGNLDYDAVLERAPALELVPELVPDLPRRAHPVHFGAGEVEGGHQVTQQVEHSREFNYYGCKGRVPIFGAVGVRQLLVIIDRIIYDEASLLRHYHNEVLTTLLECDQNIDRCEFLHGRRQLDCRCEPMAEPRIPKDLYYRLGRDERQRV